MGSSPRHGAVLLLKDLTKVRGRGWSLSRSPQSPWRGGGTCPRGRGRCACGDPLAHRCTGTGGLQRWTGCAWPSRPGRWVLAAPRGCGGTGAAADPPPSPVLRPPGGERRREDVHLQDADGGHGGDAGGGLAERAQVGACLHPPHTVLTLTLIPQLSFAPLGAHPCGVLIPNLRHAQPYRCPCSLSSIPAACPLSPQLVPCPHSVLTLSLAPRPAAC